ncbi:MAG: hypothetical protein HC822_08515 [Oscillochloris sp.]|nr:hypothetical protein [Oscillochloris sp.]
MSGTFTIPTRIYLNDEQRDRLNRLLRHEGRELNELLSDLVLAYLSAQPEPPAPLNDHVAEVQALLQQRRSELRRLRRHLNDPHNPPPQFLIALVADLEAEVRRLEQTGG